MRGACDTEERQTYRIWLEDVKERDLLENFEVDRRIILTQILNKQAGGPGLRLCRSRRGRVAGFCEHGNERCCHNLLDILLPAEELLASKDGFFLGN